MTDNTFFAHVTSMLRHNEMMLQAEEDLRVSAEKITDDQLTKLSVNELNRYLQQLPRNERLKLKRRRRVVKNRGYASRARKKRVTQKVGLELEVSELQNEVCKLQLENDIVRMELSALRNKFAILQNVMEMNHLPVDLLSAPVDLSARAGNTQQQQQQSDDVNCFPLNMPEPLRQSRHSHCPTVTNRANEIIDNKCSFTSHDAVETDATSSSDGQKYLKRKHDSESFSRSKKCLLRFNLPKETTELENSPSFERFSTAMPYSSKDSSLISNEGVRYVELEDNRTSTDMSRSGDGMIVHRQTTRITRSLSEHSTCRNTDDVMLPQHVPLCELENTVQADGDSMHSTDQVSNTQHGNTLMLKSSERHFSMITVNGLVHAEKSGIQRIGQATDSTDETIAYSDDDDEDDDDESVRDSETESEDELDRPLITENQLDILYRPTNLLQCAQHETCIHNQQTKLQAECTHKQPLDIGIHISPSSSNTLSPPVAHSIKPTVEGQCFDTITVRQTQHEPSDMPSWLTVYERNDIATNIATNCGISDNMKKRHVVCSEKPLNIANFPACVIKTTESKRLDGLDTVPMPLQESLKIVPITSQSIDNKLKEVDSNDKAISYAVPPGTFRSVSSDSGISCSSSFECDHSDDMPLNMTKGLVSDVSPGCTGHQEADKGVSVNKCSEDAVTIPIMHRKLTNRGTNLKTFGLLYVSLFFRNKCLCVQCLHCKQMMQPLTFLTHHDDVPEDFEILKQDSMEKYSIEYVGKLSEIQWSLWVRFIECLTAQLRTEGFTFIKPEDSESITLPSLSGNVNQCTDSSDSFVEHQNIVDYSRRGIVTSDLTSKSCTRVGLLSPTKITDNQMYMHHSISSGSVMSASECSAGTSRLVASRCHSDTSNDAIDLTSSNSVKAPSSVIGSISRTVSNSEERMTKNRHDDGLMGNSSDSTALFIDTTHNGSILSDAKNTSATEYCNSRASSANSDHDYALNRPYSSIYDLLTTDTRPRFKAVDVSPTRNTFTSRNGGVRTRARSLVDRVRSDRNREKRSQYHRAQSNSGFTGNECPASSSQHLSNEAVLASEVPRQLDEHQSELAQYKEEVIQLKSGHANLQNTIVTLQAEIAELRKNYDTKQ